MLAKHERNYVLGMDALVIVCSRNTNVSMIWAWMLWSSYVLGTRTELCFGHGCSGERMLSKHERNYVLGMDALVIVCSRNTNVIMIWAWMLWSSYVLGTRTLLWFGHGCSGYRMLTKHERYYGLGMDAPVLERSRTSKNAMRGIRNISGPWNTSNVWIVPRRPHPERSAKYALFARLRSGGANNKSKSNNNQNAKNLM